MIAFALIMLTYSRRIDFEELQSLNAQLSIYNSRKLSDDELEEKIDELEEDEEESSTHYSLSIDGIKQDEPNFQSVITNNSSCRYYAFDYGKKKIVLTYQLQQEKCINHLKLEKPNNLPEDNQCIWINDLKSIIAVGKKKSDFKGEWNSEKCIKTQTITITSSFQNLAPNKLICFGELDVKD